MPTILIVEDNVQLGLFYSRVLEGLGVTALRASNCEEAFEQLNKVAPDLILLDIGLPDGDGLSIADYVKQQPTLQHTHVVAVSGNHQYSNRTKLPGIEQFLMKPVSTWMLIDTVKQYSAATS
jgi:CheY-like chemotaxis protein